MRPHRIASSAAIGIGLAFPLAAPTQAQGTQPLLCHDHVELREALLDRYHEVPVSIGLQTDGQLVQVFASAETGTWTILMTRPDGVACILSAGKHYEQRALQAPGAEAADGAAERAS